MLYLNCTVLPEPTPTPRHFEERCCIFSLPRQHTTNSALRSTKPPEAAGFPHRQPRQRWLGCRTLMPVFARGCAFGLLSRGSTSSKSTRVERSSRVSSFPAGRASQPLSGGSNATLSLARMWKPSDRSVGLRPPLKRGLGWRRSTTLFLDTGDGCVWDDRW